MEETVGLGEGLGVSISEGSCILSQKFEFSVLTFLLFNMVNTETCPYQKGSKGLQNSKSELAPGPQSATSCLQPATGDLDAFPSGRTKPQRWRNSKEKQSWGGLTGLRGSPLENMHSQGGLRIQPQGPVPSHPSLLAAKQLGKQAQSPLPSFSGAHNGRRRRVW